MSAEKKKLILVRHAHRDTTAGRLEDNGLTEKGRRQAAALLKRYGKKLVGKDVELWSSPKLRCVETLEPLAKFLGLEIQISSLLDEQQEDEEGFLKRVDGFELAWIKSGPAIVVAASHGDWIPTFIGSATGKWVELNKGAIAVLVYKDGEVRLKNVRQEL